MKILVTGGRGYVAKGITPFLKNKHEVTTVTRKDFDLCDTRSTLDWFDDKHFDVVIHTAAKGGSRLQEDDKETCDLNLKMYYNLLACKDHFSKFISFGSGAELFKLDTRYGMSKRIIADSMLCHDNFYNLRIFAVFDHNEIETRFIRSCIRNYLNKEPIRIHQNTLFDFFHMDDLSNLVDHYVGGNKLCKTVNCSYEDKKSLLDIANMVNDLSNHKVKIQIEESGFDFYCGESNLPTTNLVGLVGGINRTFDVINREYLHKGTLL